MTKTNPYGTNQTQTAVGDLNMGYAYNAEGKLASVVYPTDAGTNTTPGYNYSFDAMMRPSGMTDQASNTLVSGVTYGVANEMSSMSYDGGTENRSYNTMFQLTNITFGNQQNITYNFPAGTNNGKIASQTDAVSGETVSYQYDSLNRLIAASAASWSQTYSYDGFGNLTGRVGTGTAQSTTISTPADAATNRLSGYSYDANGNLLSTGNLYDAENRLRQANMPGGTIQYFYDGGNKRIWQGQFTSSGDPQLLTVETVAMFGADGKLAGSYTPQANWNNTQNQATITFAGSQRVYFGGKLIKSGGGNVVQDRLGSVGKFYPYGEQRDSSAAMFATYTRDGTGLDYADQRYYASTFGRFMSADPYIASSTSPSDPKVPQSWNRYAYVVGDPANAYDPHGLASDPPCGGGDCLISDGGNLGGTCLLDGMTVPCEFATAFVAEGAAVVGPYFVPIPPRLGGETAQQALGSASCASLFGMGDLSPFHLVDSPMLKITYLFDPLHPGRDATAFLPGRMDSPDPAFFVIQINTGSDNFMAGPSEQANTFIHELLHFALYLGFAVDPRWIQSDGGNEAAEKNNNNLIVNNCGVGTLWL